MGEGYALAGVGMALGDLGQQEEAEQCLHQALTIFTELDDRWMQDLTLTALGTCS